MTVRIFRFKGALALGAVLVLGGCGDDGTAGGQDTGIVDAMGDAASSDVLDTEPGDTGALGDTSAGQAARKCDPLDPFQCSFPWPSNLYMADDDDTVTGYRLRFVDGLPMNANGKPLNPAPYSRLDGFGPTSPLMVHFGAIDLGGMAKEYHTTPSLAAEAPILWFEVTEAGLERVPYWVDVDVIEEDAERRVLLVRPAVILKEAARYVVAFRDLKRPDGAEIPASAAFASLRDKTASGDPALAPRVDRFEQVFGLLADAGIERQGLTLAWDFVTASSDAMHGPMLKIRDEALEAVGVDGPELVGLEVEELDTPDWAFEVRGRFRVPSYMEAKTPLTGSSDVEGFVYGDDGMPRQNGWEEPEFIVRVPRTALDGTPHGLVLFGHGQNGLAEQVRSGDNGKIANDHHLIFFACDLRGLAEYDVLGIISFLTDLSGFENMSDELHQGVLNNVLLARGIKQRLGGLEEMTSRGVVVDTTQLYYSGISQGGIYGPTIVALSPDITRGHFGVPGNTYSYLVLRSGNFAAWTIGLKLGYETRPQLVTAINAIQLLWNGTDSATYIRHLHDPLPNSPVSEGLWAPAKGDPQVPVTSNEPMMRSQIGIPVLENYDTERQVTGAEVATYPHTGSGVVLYDFGNPWPAESELAPPTSEVEDPHWGPRRSDVHNAQMVHFFKTGVIKDFCGGDGCAPD